MARNPQVEFPGAPYHVIPTGNRGTTSFHDDVDFAAYLERLERYRWRDSLRVLCLYLDGQPPSAGRNRGGPAASDHADFVCPQKTPNPLMKYIRGSGCVVHDIAFHGLNRVRDVLGFFSTRPSYGNEAKKAPTSLIRFSRLSTKLSNKRIDSYCVSGVNISLFF